MRRPKDLANLHVLQNFIIFFGNAHENAFCGLSKEFLEICEGIGAKSIETVRDRIYLGMKEGNDGLNIDGLNINKKGDFTVSKKLKMKNLADRKRQLIQMPDIEWRENLGLEESKENDDRTAEMLKWKQRKELEDIK